MAHQPSPKRLVTALHHTLECAACGADHAVDQPQNLCRKCGKPLLARYDLAAIRGQFTLVAVQARPTRSMWRFHEVLPVDDPREAVSLGEGGTPLLRARRTGACADFENFWIKDEALNPTGSFKARGMAAAITRARHLGVDHVALPSAGNAAGAAAAYAARAGMRCTLFMPVDTPPANVIESVAQGASVYLVKGLISDCGKLVRVGTDRFGWFDLSTLKEPFRIEGKKTMGYELALDFTNALAASREPARENAEQNPPALRTRNAELVPDPRPPSPDLSSSGPLAQLPDVILYPAGGGTGLIGMWKAFDEIGQLGWIGDRRPRMVVVQAAGCAPIVRAWEQGKREAAFFDNAHTVASGLRVPAAIGDFLMLDVLRKSNGRAVAVSDEDLLAGAREMSATQGVFACPESGAVWVAARRLLDEGWIKPHEHAVLFNTASGLKYTHLITPDLPVIDPSDPDWQRHLTP